MSINKCISLRLLDYKPEPKLNKFTHESNFASNTVIRTSRKRHSIFIDNGKTQSPANIISHLLYNYFLWNTPTICTFSLSKCVTMSQGLAESYAGKTESVPSMKKIILFYKIQNCTRFFQTITKAYMDIYTKEVKVHGKKVQCPTHCALHHGSIKDIRWWILENHAILNTHGLYQS